MKSAKIKQVQNLLKGKEQFPKYYLFAFQTCYKLSIEDKTSVRYKVLNEESAMAHMTKHPKTGIVIFTLNGVKCSDVLTIYKHEVKEIYPHQVDELKEFLLYPFKPYNKALTEDENLTLLSLDEIKIMANFSRIFKY